MRRMTTVKRFILTAAVLAFGFGLLSAAEVRAGEEGVMTKIKVVDLNRATVDELAAIEAIGPDQAQYIVDFRDENGPFLAVEDLLLVAGMDEALIAKIRSQVVVEAVETEEADHEHGEEPEGDSK